MTMTSSLFAKVAGFALPLCTLLGCSIAADDFAGKTCNVAADCPSPYSCVETGVSLRTCEIIQAPLANAGPEFVAAPADWCNDVKPLMVKYCAECHGTNNSGGVGFRLHQYENAGPEGNEDGAKDKANRIKARFVDAFGTSDAMPPPPDRHPGPQPASKDETQVVSGWIGAGTPRALEGKPDCADTF